MVVRIKFCGMSRPSDVSLAAELGAAYVGAVFAPGPRRISPSAAREIFTSAPRLHHVGVFGTNDIREIGAAAEEADLDVVQLHADPTPDDVHAVRSAFGGEVWAALRIQGSSLPENADELFDAADGIVLDAKGERPGGTGIKLPWDEIAADVSRLRGGGLLVLAGGLNAENVADAVHVLAPDVVDVSSGVELSPGIKDPDRLRRFAQAVAEVSG